MGSNPTDIIIRVKKGGRVKCGIIVYNKVPRCLMVRIPPFQGGGPGSIPGVGSGCYVGY